MALAPATFFAAQLLSFEGKNHSEWHEPEVQDQDTTLSSDYTTHFRLQDDLCLLM